MTHIPINREQAEGVDDCLRHRELPLVKGGQGRDDADTIIAQGGLVCACLLTAGLTALLIAIFTS